MNTLPSKTVAIPYTCGLSRRSALALGFASKPSPSAPWARGLMSAFWERGSLDLPACGPQCGSIGGPLRPIFIDQGTQDPREGPSLTGRTTWSFLRHGLVRMDHEEAERSRRGTSRGTRDASHDDSGHQAGASPRSILLSSLVQRGQAQTRSTEASGKGCHFGATRHETEVIVEPKTASPPELCAGEDYFCQDSWY